MVFGDNAANGYTQFVQCGSLLGGSISLKIVEGMTRHLNACLECAQHETVEVTMNMRITLTAKRANSRLTTVPHSFSSSRLVSTCKIKKLTIEEYCLKVWQDESRSKLLHTEARQIAQFGFGGKL